MAVNYSRRALMFHSRIDQHKLDCFVATYASDAEVVKHRRGSNGATLIQRYFGQPTGPHKANTSRVVM